MSEATAHLATPADGYLDALAAAAWMFEWPMPRERDEAVCAERARLIDALLAPIARCRGALDVAIGAGLDALGIGDRVLRLGYCGIGDYARERLGIAASTAQKMARLARELRDRPTLRAAVWAGEVSVRQAEAMMRVAHGDAEESWVARARMGTTVRALKAAAKDPGSPEPEEDEEWVTIREWLSPEERRAVDEAMGLAKKELGKAPKWERTVPICQEFLNAHPPEDGIADDQLESAAAED